MPEFFLYFRSLVEHCTVDTGEGVLIFLDLELRVHAKNVDNLKLEKVEFDDFYIKNFSDNAISK